MIAADTQTYQQEFTRFREEQVDSVAPWLKEIRQRGLNRFLELGFPSTREEEWRFTNVAPLRKQTFTRPRHGAIDVSQVEQSLESAPLDGAFHRLVFINGRLTDVFSRVEALPSGVVLESLAEAVRTNGNTTQLPLAKHADYEHASFTALNTAFVDDGAHVHISDGVAVEKPIQLIFVSCADTEPVMTHPRNVISLGQRSRATVMESYLGVGGERYFTNAVTEVELRESAHLVHCKLQQEQGNAFHIADTEVLQKSGSRLRSHYLSLGGSLVRNELHSVLDGEGSDCTLHGLYMASDRQHMDCRTRIDHAKPNCTSFEMYKGILDDRARGVFNGKVYVHPNAQKTDAKQSNQALLLSDDAVIDTKPQLEIYADDVRCTHGATVGDLDDDTLYYLRSRGIPTRLARSLLVYAFCNEIVQGIEVEPVRRYLENFLLADRGLPYM
jgi:Fe-S cluster assembly protein SufD